MQNKRLENMVTLQIIISRNLEAFVKRYGIIRKGGYYEGRYWVADKKGGAK